MKTTGLLIAASAVAVAVGAHEGASSQVKKAVAVLQSAKDGTVQGVITFEQAADGVKVSGAVSGLTPGGHGFHVHEFGDCSAPDFTSAGGHFNPGGQAHGAPGDAKRHAGDLGNIEAAADGKAPVSHTDVLLKLDGAVGRAVIVHAKADDLKTQPTGDAGGRLACGVIGVAKAQ
jgi:Cu-Zn family superoxide dismutase